MLTLATPRARVRGTEPDRGYWVDVWGAIRLLRRRWYIALPSIILSVGIAALAFASIPTRYESTGAVVLTSPASGPRFSGNTAPQDVVRVNPLLAFDGSLTTTALLLSQILGDPQTHVELGATSETGTTYVASTGDANGPFVFVTVESNSAEAAQLMVGKVLDRARQELEERQRSLQAPEPTFITSEMIVQPTEAEGKIGGKVRYAGASMIVLLLMTTALTFGSDSFIDKRNRRRALRDGGAAAEQPEPPAAEPPAAGKSAATPQQPPLPATPVPQLTPAGPQRFQLPPVGREEPTVNGAGRLRQSRHQSPTAGHAPRSADAEATVIISPAEAAKAWPGKPDSNG